MRLIGLMGTVVAMLAIGVPYAAAQTQDEFFDDTFVHELRMDIRNSDWDLLRQNFLDNTYYPIVFHWIYKGKDIVVNDVGIRSRGHGSRSPVKPNLRVDVNRYAPGQTFLGLGSFVLKANNQDPSMLKERSVFKLWDRTGLPASRETFVRLYVNNVYYGVFLLTEELRTEYTQRYLNDTNGDLYEWKPLNDPGYHFEWYPTCTDKIPQACSTDPAKWAPFPWNPEENKSTFDLTPTINMIRSFTQASDADFEKTVSAQLDIKLWMMHNAIENYVADFDSILGDVFGMNNFWLYRYVGTNFHQFLLWDKDSSYDWSGRSIFQNADQNVLMRRTLALPNRRAQYLESQHKVAVLAGGAGGWLEWEIQREYNLAAPSIREDPFKQYGDNGVNKNSTNEIFEAQVLKDYQFVEDRYPFVRQELATAGIQYPSSPNLFTGGAVNAATNALGAIAPGSYVSLYGSGITTDTLEASGPFPTTLGGVTVFVNGFPAPIRFVSPGQINIQVPWELGMGNGTTPFTVMVNGPTAKGTRANSPVNGTFSNSITSAVGLFSPGIFNVALADGTLVSSKPAKAGDVLVIFANGLGPVNNQPASGALSPSDPAKLATAQQLPTVTIGDLPASVQFAGLAPGFVGAYQVNVVVPDGVRSGSAPLVITAGGINSPAFSLPIQ